MPGWQRAFVLSSLNTGFVWWTAVGLYIKTVFSYILGFCHCTQAPPSCNGILLNLLGNSAATFFPSLSDTAACRRIWRSSSVAVWWKLPFSKAFRRSWFGCCELFPSCETKAHSIRSITKSVPVQKWNKHSWEKFLCPERQMRHPLFYLRFSFPCSNMLSVTWVGKNESLRNPKPLQKLSKRF